jgi:hypothetical protein
MVVVIESKLPQSTHRHTVVLKDLHYGLDRIYAYRDDECLVIAGLLRRDENGICNGEYMHLKKYAM